MRTILFLLFATLRDTFRRRAALQLELLAQRQQLAVLKRKTARPCLRSADRLFWVLLSRLWPGWRRALMIVRPETVIAWHRKGFRLYWTWKSRRGKSGRPPASVEVRALIRRMSRENPALGRAADPWGVAEAWPRGLGSDRVKILDASAQTAVANMRGLSF